MFTEEVRSVLTEDTLNAIESAFNEKVKLNVEAALIEQDEVYAQKLKVLLETLDKDRSTKLKRIVDAIDKQNAAKLVKITRLYERANKQDAKNFKSQLVESISNYLEEYLDKTIDKEDIQVAVRNKTAYSVLENLRKVLAVDSVLMKESVQEAVIDGKNQITKLEKENQELKKQYKALYEHNQKTEVTALLENMTAKLPDTKKSFMKKALGDKSVKFIKENFDYTLRLFEKQEKSKLETLKEDALNKRVVKPDFVQTQKVVEEKVNNNNLTDEYLNILSKGKGIK